jgi:predicted ester cyclase
MSVEENKKLYIRFLDEDYGAKGDPAKLKAVWDKYYTPGTVYHSSSNELNLDQWKQFETAFWKSFPDAAYTNEDILGEGDKVIIRNTIRATDKGGFMGRPPTGKKISFSVIGISKMAGEKILEAWNAGDDLGLMRQLGIIPA